MKGNETGFLQSLHIYHDDSAQTRILERKFAFLAINNVIKRHEQRLTEENRIIAQFAGVDRVTIVDLFQ